MRRSWANKAARIISCTTSDVFAYFRVPLTWRELARRTLADTLEDDCPGLAAQLAFYFFLSVFPALLFVVSLLGYLPVETRLAGTIARLEAFLPHQILVVAPPRGTHTSFE